VKRWWTGLPAERRGRIVVGAVRGVFLVVLIAAAGVGMYFVREFVMSRPQYADSVARIELRPRPAWMSDMLAAEIAGQLARAAGRGRCTFDPTLARRVHAAAEQCVWIRRVHEVRVERAATDEDDGAFSAGRVVVVAEYRRPEAVGVFDRHERYVAADRVVLPFDLARHLAGREHMVRIRGLRVRPPATGERWAGEDLAAGIRVIRLLRGKPYYRQIAAVDVRNFDRRYERSEPAIRLLAVNDDYVTDIRFGDLPADGVPPVGAPTLRRKLGYLDSWYRRNAYSLAGPTYLDLRYSDRIGYPRSYTPAYQ